MPDLDYTFCAYINNRYFVDGGSIILYAQAIVSRPL